MTSGQEGGFRLRGRKEPADARGRQAAQGAPVPRLGPRTWPAPQMRVASQNGLTWRGAGLYMGARPSLFGRPCAIVSALMCHHEDGPGLPLMFARFVEFLREPPFEPCESELQYLSSVEYEQAFTETVRAYYHKVRRYVARITNNHDLATDVAQVVFLNLYRARASFDGAYIYRTARNAALSAMRQTQRRRTLETRWAGVEMHYARKELQEFEATDARPPQDVELFERARVEAARNAVDRLPEKFREPLVLLATGRSYREITEITGANEGTVKSRICRGEVDPAPEAAPLPVGVFRPMPRALHQRRRGDSPSRRPAWPDSTWGFLARSLRP